MLSDRSLLVYREYGEGMQLVGRVCLGQGEESFSYDETYLRSPSAAAVSVRFPLRKDPYSPRETLAYFDGLLPEGSRRSLFARAVHADSSDTLAILSRLNLESVGGLVFAEEGVSASGEGYGYTPIPFSCLEEFARSPRAKALDLSVSSRLSLAGAQSKIGLRHDGDDMRDEWSVTEGLAPSTHIIKAVDGSFKFQTINEALCLEVARRLGFSVADAVLIKIDGCEPLLCVRRFDRVVDRDGGVRRVHQEDFCQGMGLSPRLKYEPTEGNYLNKMAYLVARESSDAFGDRIALFDSVLLDWALGNCDNHLKNRSLLWSSDWMSKGLSPLYDITCTTFYPEMDREMGVSLCASRKIHEISRGDIWTSAKSAGVPRRIAEELLEELADDFEPALSDAEKAIGDQGYIQVEEIADHIRAEWRAKLSSL